MSDRPHSLSKSTVRRRKVDREILTTVPHSTLSAFPSSLVSSRTKLRKMSNPRRYPLTVRFPCSLMKRSLSMYCLQLYDRSWGRRERWTREMMRERESQLQRLEQGVTGTHRNLRAPLLYIVYPCTVPGRDGLGVSLDQTSSRTSTFLLPPSSQCSC